MQVTLVPSHFVPGCTPAVSSGAAAVASAAAALTYTDGDKLLALGARVLSVTTPFVAAAAGRSDLEEQLELTNRLQQLMLAAARLAGRHGVLAAGRSSTAGAAPAPASAVGTCVQIPEGHGTSDISGSLQEHRHHHTLVAHRPQKGVGRQMRAGTSKLATRKANKKQAGFAGFGALGRKGAAPPQLYRRVQSPVQNRESSLTSWNGLAANRSLAVQQQQEVGAVGLDDGMAEEMQRQLAVSEFDLTLAPEDLEHPWSWDVTQSLAVLSSDIKVRHLRSGKLLSGCVHLAATVDRLIDSMHWLLRCNSATGCLLAYKHCEHCPILS